MMKTWTDSEVEVDFMKVTGGLGSGFITNHKPKMIGNE